MGEVRSTLADPTTSPIKKIQEAKEQVYDLIQIKRKDLAAEGPSMIERNQKSINALQKAVDGLNEAELTLKTY